MPISSVVNFNDYVADSHTSQFAFTHYLSSLSDLLVYTLNLSTHEIIQYLWNQPGGITISGSSLGPFPNGVTVIFPSAPTTGLLVALTRKTAETQLIEFIDNAPFTAESLNNALDKLTLEIQDISSGFKGYVYNHPTDAQGITYATGDWFRSRLPAQGLPFGWVCITDGDPGAWKSFGLIGEDVIIAELQSDVSTLQEQVIVLQQEIDVLEEQIVVLQQEIVVVEEQIVVVEEQVTILQNEDVNLQNQINGINNTLIDLHLEIVDLQNSINAINESLGWINARTGSYLGQILNADMNHIDGIHPPPRTEGYHLGDWFTCRDPNNVPFSQFGWMCTGEGNPGTWNAIALLLP